MNAEIIHFKTVNDNLSLIVKDLKLRQKGMQKEILKYNKIYKTNDEFLNMFKDDLQICFNTIGDYKILQDNVLKILF